MEEGQKEEPLKETSPEDKEEANALQEEGEKEASEHAGEEEKVEEVQSRVEHCLEDTDVDMLDPQSAAETVGEENESVDKKEAEEEREEVEDLSKLKVVDLRSRLQAAGINCRGTKAVLVERLAQVEKEKKDEEQTEEMDEAEGATILSADQDVQMEDQAEAVTIEDVPDEDGSAAVPELSNEEDDGKNEEDEGNEELDSTTNYSKPVDDEMEGVVVSSAWQEATGWEAVRDVYRRACVVHCPRKAVI